MTNRIRGTWVSAFIVGSIGFISPVAGADSVQKFYQGKDITVVVGFNPGGSYDTYARLVASTWGKYIPGNPNIIVRNMPGAGSRNAGNHIANRSPRDGTEVGMISGIVAINPLIGEKSARFDSRKLNWIGNPTISTGVCISWHTSAASTIDDVFKTRVVTGVSGGTTNIYPLMLNEVIGTKFKLIAGYRGAADLTHAIQSQEIEAFCGNVYPILRARFPEWLRAGGQANILVQFGLEKHPDMPDVPLVMDLAKNAEQKAILRLIVGATTKVGYPFVAPPQIPADRLDALRTSYNANMKDPQLLERAKKSDLDLELVTGQELQSFMEEMYALPPEIVKKVSNLIIRQ